MPPKTFKKTTAPIARGGFGTGKDRPQRRRQGSEPKHKKSTSVIANSIFALTLGEKPGIEVHQKMEGMSSVGDKDDLVKMYEDLLKAYQNALFLTTGQVSTVNPLKEGLNISASLAFVVSGFKNNILMGGYDLRIDNDDSGYYFTMFTQCDFPEMWHAFALKDVVDWLQANRPGLLQLFLEFMNYMRNKLHINCWYNGAFGYADFAAEERLNEDWFQQNYGEFEPEEGDSENRIKKCMELRQQYEAFVDDYSSYKAGLVKVYEDFFRSNVPVKDSILSRLNKAEDIPLVKWMKDMMEFIDNPFSMLDFYYQQLIEDGYWEGIHFDRQVSLVWDWEDQITEVEMEAMDADYSAVGLIPPIAHISVSKFTKELDLSKYHMMHLWPMKLHTLWDRYQNIYNNAEKQLKRIR